MPQVDPTNLQWYPVAALFLWALIRLWSTKAPSLWNKIPDGWKWLPPALLGAGAGFVEAQVTGLPLKQALLHAAMGFFGIGMPASGLHGWLTESVVPYDGGAGGKPKPPEGPPKLPDLSTPKEAETLPPEELTDLPTVKLSPRGALFIVAVSIATAFLPIYVGSCGLFGGDADKAQKHLVELAKVEAWNGAVVALEVAAVLERDRVKAIEKPTDADVKKAEENLARLKRARDALAIAKSYIEGKEKGDEKKALRDSLEALELVVDELKADGVKVPDSVTKGLKLARLFAGVS